MMDVPLNSWMLFEHAEVHHAETEIVSRRVDGGLHRYTYAAFARRAQQLMHGLGALGVAEGATVGTLAWNGFRHLEAYFAVPCTGRILHTINLRLSSDELAYVINHAGDQVLLVDADLLGLLEPIADKIPSVRHIVVMGESPSNNLPLNTVSYEDLIAAQPSNFPPRDIPEQAPMGICYTSGTTGRPKAAVYTHRSTFLHALGVSSGAGFAIGPTDCVLPQVPMFHANAWGSVHASIAVGAKLVLYAGALDPESFVDLLVTERVTISAGVPTVWLTVADTIEQRPGELANLRHIVCGGSQPPRALIRRYLTEFGVPILQAWGMTETSPLASVAWPQARMSSWDADRVMDVARTRAGLPLPGVSLSIRDETGVPLPFDGAGVGELHVRGPWVIDRYLNDESSDSFTDDGWFRTGDVAVGSSDGYFVITDRNKDLIKSGGEWISSIDMEAAIMSLPGVAEAAVIALPDDKWQERPLACLVLREGMTETLESVQEQLTNSGFARWQLPERIEVLAEIPKTSVGKFDKKELRRQYAHAAGVR